MVEGYTERLLDQQIQGLFTGYWAGYYSNSGSRTKPVKTILEKLEKARAGTEQVPDVNVEAFLEIEKRFKERMGGV